MEILDDSNEKIINDPINGIIVIDEYALKVIDTEEFQRLRSLKQLGFVYQVFPGRFDSVHPRIFLQKDHSGC